MGIQIGGQVVRKEIRRVDPERGVCQITLTDERWYSREVEDKATGLPKIQFRPSVTWICDSYPKGIGFHNWLKKNGDESDQIARLAADRGYKVHRACAMLNDGETFGIADPVENQNGEFEELTPEEYSAVMSYVDWWETIGYESFEILEYETTVWPDAKACAAKYGISSEYFNYAGTLDLLVQRKTDGARGVIDFKTSLDVWPSNEMQVCAYQRAKGADFAAILQLNYKRNKKQKWKWTQVDDCFDLFIATQKIWARESDGVKPLQRDYPLALKLRGREPRNNLVTPVQNEAALIAELNKKFEERE